tara:strand:+ start:201 stop:827 length:627 start_codon:yes stop_codon:yes gene_type:complete
MNLMKLSHINHETRQTTKGIKSKTRVHLKSKTQKQIEEPTMSHEEISRYHFEHVMRNNNSTTPMGTKYMRTLVHLALNGQIDNPEPALKLIKAYIRTEEQKDVAIAAKYEIERLNQAEKNITQKINTQNDVQGFLHVEEKEAFKTPPRGKGKPINQIHGSPQSVAFTEKEIEPKKEIKKVCFDLPKKVDFVTEKSNHKPYFLLPWDLI